MLSQKDALVNHIECMPEDERAMWETLMNVVSDPESISEVVYGAWVGPMAINDALLSLYKRLKLEPVVVEAIAKNHLFRTMFPGTRGVPQPLPSLAVVPDPGVCTRCGHPYTKRRGHHGNNVCRVCAGT
jgi:hypothetical protein